MFCPNCGAEYRAGITVCADCNIPLVPDPPPPFEEESVLTTVLETGDLAVVALAKSMLDEAGIKYVAKGELPLEQLAVGPVQIQVDKDDAAVARDLLSDLSEGISYDEDVIDEDEPSEGELPSEDFEDER